MSDYLTNLLIRTRYPERTIQPRSPSMFDPALPGSTGGEVQGGSLSGEPDPAVNVEQQAPRRDLPPRRSPEATGQDPEDARPILEQETQRRELALESTVVLERRHSSSETTSLPEPKDVASVADTILDPARMKSGDAGGITSSRPIVPLSENSTVQPGHASAQEISFQHHEDPTTLSASVSSVSMGSEQRLATPRDPSENKAVSLSPVDWSIVGASSPVSSIGPGQEDTAARHKPAGQSASPPLQLPGHGGKVAGTGKASPLIEHHSSKQRPIPSIVTASQARDHGPNSHADARGVHDRASSPRHPLVGAPTARGDGEPQLQPQQRLPAAVSEPRRTIPTPREAAAGEMPNISELSLDSSLVSPAQATKPDGASRVTTSRKPLNGHAVSSSPADQPESLATDLAVPLSSKKSIAGLHLASPMKATTISDALAKDAVKPADPVVQVTIGRVEVRAVSSPVRQEKSQKPQPAMSLDDYLKRRGGQGGG